jgi:hypothetical protein
VQPAAAQIAAQLTHLRDETAPSPGAVQPNAPSRSATKPSTDTFIESIGLGFTGA